MLRELQRSTNNYQLLPMRLWFAHSSEVPIYRQLVTQVVLAILSGDLRPGDRLPSTRELARRFGLHPNTVSAGYRQLEKEGWTESRRGSGIYIRENAEPPSTPEQRIDHHIAGFFRAAREMGLPGAAVRARVLGSRSPGRRSPDRMASTTWVTSCR